MILALLCLAWYITGFAVFMSTLRVITHSWRFTVGDLIVASLVGFYGPLAIIWFIYYFALEYHDKELW